MWNFYPRSPCGERLTRRQLPTPEPPNFYPRSPCGERLTTLPVLFRKTIISIHALLAESDGVWRHWGADQPDFYPRSPCGERLMLFTSFLSFGEFLSTLSLRRATLPRSADCSCRSISIHALLAESDQLPLAAARAQANFYPRSPCGERRR